MQSISLALKPTAVTPHHPWWDYLRPEPSLNASTARERATASGGIPHLEMPSQRVFVFLHFCHYFPYEFEHQISSGTCSDLKKQNKKMMVATSVESRGWKRLSALVNVLLQENLQALDVGLEKSSEVSVRESSLLVSADWKTLCWKWTRAKQTVWLLCS